MTPRISVPFMSLALLAPLPVHGVPVTINYTDGGSEGFNDATVVGTTTLGALRKSAFQYAVDLWADTLGGATTIVVDAHFDPLGGTAKAAVLAAAGPKSICRDFTGAPVADTWYGAALANQPGGADLNGAGTAEIDAVFNTDVDNAVVLGAVDWYYGTDGQPGSHIDLVTTALHELAHGLNFVDLIDSTSGAFLFEGKPGIYDRNLFRNGTVDLQFPAMTNAQRLAAITAGDSNSGAPYTPTGEVVWNGATGVAWFGGNIPIYAPNPYEEGSSISHFATEITTNPLMEPFDTGPKHKPLLTIAVLRDMGWTIQDADGDGVPDVLDNCPDQPNPGQEDCIPTLSEWGLLVFGLLTATGGTLVLRRRSALGP